MCKGSDDVLKLYSCNNCYLLNVSYVQDTVLSDLHISHVRCLTILQTAFIYHYCSLDEETGAQEKRNHFPKVTHLASGEASDPFLCCIYIR